MDLVTLGSSAEDEDSPLVFLEKVHSLRERVEKFIETPLPSVVSLSVTPRAAAYLQQHWPAVTIGSLEDAPVPKVCCCARCGVAEMEVDVVRPDREARHMWREPHPSGTVLLLGLLLLLAALWLNPVGGASLGFSLLSRCSQLVQGLSSELVASVWDAAASAYVVMEAAVQGWSSQLSSARDKVFQQAAASFKTLFQ